MWANVGVVVFVVVGVTYAVFSLRRHRRGIVAERGMSIGADLGSLADKPRVRVRSVTRTGADRVHVLLAPETGRDGPELASRADLDLVVSMSAEDFGFGLLQGWQASQNLLAIVIPPGSRLVRLRSVDDLQPLTMSRVDDD